jgi:hypothetical protein
MDDGFMEADRMASLKKSDTTEARSIPVDNPGGMVWTTEGGVESEVSVVSTSPFPVQDKIRAKATMDTSDANTNVFTFELIFSPLTF